jgi:uncharacterized membrane protein YidH (DUF202 family)
MAPYFRNRGSSERILLRDWLFNAASYLLALVAIAIVTALIADAFPGTDESPPSQGTVDRVIGRTIGMLIYWGPGVAAALSTLLPVSRIRDRRLRRLVTSLTPITVVGGWIVAVFALGQRQVFLSSGPNSIAPLGWIVTALALLAVGLVARSERTRPTSKPPG